MKNPLQVLLLIAAVALTSSTLHGQTAALKTAKGDAADQLAKTPQHNNIQINSGVIVLNAFEVGAVSNPPSGKPYRD